MTFNMTETESENFTEHLQRLSMFAQQVRGNCPENGILSKHRENIQHEYGGDCVHLDSFYSDAVFGAIEHLADVIDALLVLVIAQRSPSGIAAMSRVVMESAASLLCIVSRKVPLKEGIQRILRREARRLREDYFHLDPGNGWEALTLACRSAGIIGESETLTAQSSVKALGPDLKPEAVLEKASQSLPPHWDQLWKKTNALGSFSIHGRVLGSMLFYPLTDEKYLTRGRLEMRAHILSLVLTVPIVYAWHALLEVEVSSEETERDIAMLDLQVSNCVKAWLEFGVPHI